MAPRRMLAHACEPSCAAIARWPRGSGSARAPTARRARRSVGRKSASRMRSLASAAVTTSSAAATIATTWRSRRSAGRQRSVRARTAPRAGRSWPTAPTPRHAWRAARRRASTRCGRSSAISRSSSTRARVRRRAAGGRWCAGRDGSSRERRADSSTARIACYAASARARAPMSSPPCATPVSLRGCVRPGATRAVGATDGAAETTIWSRATSGSRSRVRP